MKNVLHRLTESLTFTAEEQHSRFSSQPAIWCVCLRTDVRVGSVRIRRGLPLLSAHTTYGRTGGGKLPQSTVAGGL